jgi:DNA-binding NarL/FixJ family response regulator
VTTPDTEPDPIAVLREILDQCSVTSNGGANLHTDMATWNRWAATLDHAEAQPGVRSEGCRHCTPLTPEMLKVIAALAQGHAVPRIGRDLDTPPRTLRTHIATAAARLGLLHTPQPCLVDYAYRHGHLSVPAVDPRDPLGPLTPTEAQTLSAITRGLTVAQAASEIRRSRHTVNTHRGALYRRLGAHTGAHAVALAWQHGLLTREPA